MALLSGEEAASKEGNRGTGFPQEGVTGRPLGGPLPSELRDEVFRVQKQLAALERLERKWCPRGHGLQGNGSVGLDFMII